MLFQELIFSISSLLEGQESKKVEDAHLPISLLLLLS